MASQEGWLLVRGLLVRGFTVFSYDTNGQVEAWTMIQLSRLLCPFSTMIKFILVTREITTGTISPNEVSYTLWYTYKFISISRLELEFPLIYGVYRSVLDSISTCTNFNKFSIFIVSILACWELKDLTKECTKQCPSPGESITIKKFQNSSLCIDCIILLRNMSALRLSMSVSCNFVTTLGSTGTEKNLTFLHRDVWHRNSDLSH